MDDNLSLEDVHPEQIKHISWMDKDYTSIINVTDFRLAVYDSSHQYPYSSRIPIKEIFPIPSAYPLVNYNYSFTNVTIEPKDFLSDENGNYVEAPWPLGGSYNNYTITITNYTILNNISDIVGNITFLDENSALPDSDEQYGRIYLINESEECQSRLENLTNAMGVIILDLGKKIQINASKCSCSILKVNTSDGDGSRTLFLEK